MIKQYKNKQLNGQTMLALLNQHLSQNSMYRSYLRNSGNNPDQFASLITKTNIGVIGL